jgi:hypothetical protein
LQRNFSGSATENYFLFTAVLRDAPAENFGTFAAGIFNASPVLGLRPVRAARLPTEKVPKPTRVTLSPLRKELVTVSVNASIKLLQEDLLAPGIFLAIASINSDLFMALLFYDDATGTRVQG